MEKRVILLNGPSSSGKSTLSRSLQKLMEAQGNRRYEVVSIDDFMKLSQEETIYEDDVFEIAGEMCQAALEILKTGAGVIIDHVITSERIFNQLLQMLAGFAPVLVHVTCPLEVLREREEARKNRCLGSAESSWTYLFPKDGYDLTVDTHRMTSAECAAAIFDTVF